MRCPFPRRRKDGFLFPCGTCIACLINEREEWTVRLRDEYELHKPYGSFVTFTYDEEHIPADCSVHKSETSDLMKRLRYYDTQLHGKDHRIRYYIAAEYGEEGFRPHYHGIFYGLDCFDQNARKCFVNAWSPRCPEWQFNGLHGIGDLQPGSFSYVAGYLQKAKLLWRYHNQYEKYGLEKPFSVKSKGLGRDYALANRDLIVWQYAHPELYKAPTPRYYRKLLGLNAFQFPERKDVFMRQQVEFEKSWQLNQTFKNYDVDKAFELCKDAFIKEVRRDDFLRSQSAEFLAKFFNEYLTGFRHECGIQCVPTKILNVDSWKEKERSYLQALELEKLV